ncbi:MAG: prenyltransferase/squalene oxidase repeat-containing protein [Anaerolineae bacterium]
MSEIITRLLQSAEPAVRAKLRVNVLGQDPYSLETMIEGREVAASPLVQQLLSERDEDGRIPHYPYKKWVGAHWVLSMLADLGYPPGDESLLPLRDQVYDWLLSKEHAASIRTIDGRTRRCASQEGNAVYYTMALGLADERTEELVQRLIGWQWPDGGWNCDRRPEAAKSSFHETLIPMRGLVWHSRLTAAGDSGLAARRAAEVFLTRRMFRRQSDGSVIDPAFTKLHYPAYWHYDILCGLKVMAEAGMLRDERCREALDLLEAKQLPDGGFAAEGKYWTTAAKAGSGRSSVNWGPARVGRMNEYVTVEALQVLKAAGRLPWPPVLPPGYEG